MVTIILPSRNEIFLSKTIEDILAKAKGEIEVIAVLEGYWPTPQKREHWSTPAIVDDPRVIYLHHPKPLGMRRSINEGVAIARGDFVMKLDAHCMLGEGFDVILSENCKPNWVAVPTRHRLDPEKWEINNGGRPPVNYLYLDSSNDEINVLEWRSKNRDKKLEEKKIDDILTFQGSCFFLPRKYYYELELLDEEKYGSFRKDPQEVSFNAWTSGGRVVRNKLTWYAHLHKGKRYGRMYSPDRSDWKKGDEYVKKWWTDSAWHKQKKSFKWLIQKFHDMPTWENHEWIKEMNTPPEKLPDIYQYLEVNGKPLSRPKPERKTSRFWNEGKWKTFIEPLLPKDCADQAFVEMGCNAGIFLKLAKDKGYRQVVGVEKDKTPVEQGEKYRDALGYDYKLLKRILGGKFGENGTFDFDELPVADVTVMSTFHYYIDINSWVKYLDQLKAKSCYALLVSRPRMKRLHWKALSHYSAVQSYFKDWQEVGKIDNVSKDNDPKPRDLYSVLFKSPLIERVKISDIDTRESESNEMYLAMADLAKQIIANEKIDPLKTDYCRKWIQRKRGRWSGKSIESFVQGKFNLMLDIKRNGLRDPLIVQGDGLKLSDGGHRLVILKELGYKSVIVRKV